MVSVYSLDRTAFSLSHHLFITSFSYNNWLFTTVSLQSVHPPFCWLVLLKAIFEINLLSASLILLTFRIDDEIGEGIRTPGKMSVYERVCVFVCACVYVYVLGAYLRQFLLLVVKYIQNRCICKKDLKQMTVFQQRLSTRNVCWGDSLLIITTHTHTRDDSIILVSRCYTQKQTQNMFFDILHWFVWCIHALPCSLLTVAMMLVVVRWFYIF